MEEERIGFPTTPDSEGADGHEQQAANDDRRTRERGNDERNQGVPLHNGLTFTGRPGSDQLSNHEDRSAGPVQCSARLSRRRVAGEVAQNVHRVPKRERYERAAPDGQGPNRSKDNGGPAFHMS